MKCSTIIGSSLGGVLAEPVKNYPTIFSTGSIFATYPYLLPNLVCTAVVVFGLLVGIFFLEETHEDKKHDRDRGREMGQWFVTKIWKRDEYEPLQDKDEDLDETTSILDADGSKAYQSTGSSPTLCSSRSSIVEPPLLCLEKECRPTPTFREACTKQVCLSIIGYGILAL